MDGGNECECTMEMSMLWSYCERVGNIMVLGKKAGRGGSCYLIEVDYSLNSASLIYSVAPSRFNL